MKRRAFIKNTLGLTLFSFFVPSFVLKYYDVQAEVIKERDIVPNPKAWSNDEINIAWIGHATVLINLFGTIIITDPVLFNKIGFYLFGMTIGQSRYSTPALNFDEVPKPDLILLSHAHMDHMDYKTLEEFTSKYPKEIDCITAYNTSDVIEDLEWKSLKEMDWNDEYKLLGIKFKAIRVKHFGWRYPWEKDRSKGFMKDGRSFNAYLIEKNDKKVLFGGDTAYQEFFKEANIKEVDIAIMPVGAYNPWRFNHCNPEEAVKMAVEQLHAKNFIPIHCNTFRQGNEPIEEPLKRTMDAAIDNHINLGLKRIGETFTYKA